MDEIKDLTLSDLERLETEHQQYAQRLEQLSQIHFPSAEDQLEEVRLKKLKLHTKDMIIALRSRTAVPA